MLTVAVPKRNKLPNIIVLTPKDGEKAMQNLSLIRKICYNLMKLDKRFDKKKKMTYKKMSMLYTYHLEYVQELIFEKIVENI